MNSYDRSRHDGGNQEENIAAAASSIERRMSPERHADAPMGPEFLSGPPYNNESLLQTSQMCDDLLYANASSAMMPQQLQYPNNVLRGHQYPPLLNALPMMSGPHNDRRTARDSILLAGGPVPPYQISQMYAEDLSLSAMGSSTTPSFGGPCVAAPAAAHNSYPQRLPISGSQTAHGSYLSAAEQTHFYQSFGMNDDDLATAVRSRNVGFHTTAPAPPDNSYPSRLPSNGSRTARDRLLFAGGPTTSPPYQSIGFAEDDMATLAAMRPRKVGTHVTDAPAASHSSYLSRLPSNGSLTAHDGILLAAEQARPDQSNGLNAEDLTILAATGSRNAGPHLTASARADKSYLSLLSAGGAVTSSIDQGQQKDPGTTYPSSLFIQSDCSFLGPLHSFLRCKCIEVFVSTKGDMRAQGRGARPSKIGQVGLRCCFCKGAPKEMSAKQAVCYPSKRETIYESVRNFQRFHVMACAYIPEKTRAEYTSVTDQECSTPKKPQKYMKAYYAEAASELGIVDTPNGLVFGAPPNKSMLPSLIQAAECPDKSSSFWKTYSSVNKKAITLRKFEQVASDSTKRVIINARNNPTPFVYPEDFPTVSDFDFILFHQVIPCTPSNTILEQKRLYCDKISDLIGFRCKHCACTGKGSSDHKGKGMYFPADLNSLAESSFVQRLANHFMNCPRVPKEVKDAFDELKQLATEHTAKRGPRKRFIKKIYERMEIYSGLKS